MKDDKEASEASWLEKAWGDRPKRGAASLLLMLAKLQDKQILKDDSLIRAKLAAKAFKDTGDWEFPALIQAMNPNDDRFLVDFGKCLSGEIDSTLFDNRDRDIAELVLFNPEISAKDAVRELERRGHRPITEENYRVRKMRLLKVKPIFDKVLALTKHEAT